MGDLTAKDKAEKFRALHHAPGCFAIPNPWDAGTAKLLASLGFEALATTSAGCAFTLGRPDGAGAVSPEEALANVAQIAAATDLPVSADLENGWADRPDGVADTIRAAAAAGAVGGSIEDATGSDADPIYAIEEARDRVAAAAEAARALPFEFTLTGRAENFLHGRPDLADTIARLQAYQEAGADVLYAPGLRSLDDVRSVTSSVDRPVNVLAATGTLDVTLEELAGAGVSRVSLGSVLFRAALSEFVRIAKGVKEDGAVNLPAEMIAHATLNAAFED